MTFGRVGGVYALLSAADDVADHWGQTTRQAKNKGKAGREGQRACAAHVATLTATRAILLAAGAAAAGERIHPGRAAAGLALGAGLHYWADRRTTLRGLADRLSWAGIDAFHQVGAPRAGHDDNRCLGTGAYALDRAFHHGCRVFEAMLIAGRG